MLFIFINKSNNNNFNINRYINDKLYKIRYILISRVLKERKVAEFEFLDIVEIDINLYYYLAKNKENRLFFLIINKIYNNFTSKLIV